MADAEEFDDDKSTRRARKCKLSPKIRVKDEIRARFKQIRDILKKPEEDRSKEEAKILAESPEVVKVVQKRDQLQHAQKQRVLEIEDEAEVLNAKCLQLASAIKGSSKVVIYTGAGISTAASIPDYRGPNGVWTLLKQGKELHAQDLCEAEPTYTHMCLTQLYREGHLKHVVSQNCDGLHIRSGLPRNNLSEVHGNMFIEQCKTCKPHREFIRLFDVTENTGVRRHGTSRKCHKCSTTLQDTIVHFGEKGGLKSPYRWKEAVKAANNSDLILCLGSSLKLLKKYACLWCMDRRVQKRPNLYIVNLQWTPKDDVATLKINGRCDDVMKQVMSHLGYDVPIYKRELDPIFSLSTSLLKRELKSTSKKILEVPFGYVKPCKTRRKPSMKVKDESIDGDTKPGYPTLKTLLGLEGMKTEGLADDPRLLKLEARQYSDHDLVMVKPELIGVPNLSAMQGDNSCLRLLSRSSSYPQGLLLPQDIPALPTPFQSAVLSTSAHDLKLTSGILSQVSSKSTDLPDIPPLPGTVSLDHCYCKQNCRGRCKNSPEKAVGIDLLKASSKSSQEQYSQVQDEAMDLSSLSSRHHPEDSPSRSPVSKPPENLLVCPQMTPVLLPQSLSVETFADLQKYCMTGIPPSLQATLPVFHTVPSTQTRLIQDGAGAESSQIMHRQVDKHRKSELPRERCHSESSISSAINSSENRQLGSGDGAYVSDTRVVFRMGSSGVSHSTGASSDATERVKTEPSESEVSKYKPRTVKRLKSAPSVPGWFGKGLAIKKRKRF